MYHERKLCLSSTIKNIITNRKNSCKIQRFFKNEILKSLKALVPWQRNIDFNNQIEFLENLPTPKEPFRVLYFLRVSFSLIKL